MENTVLSPPRYLHRGKTKAHDNSRRRTNVLSGGNISGSGHKRTLVLPHSNSNSEFDIRLSYLDMEDSDQLCRYSDSIQQRIFEEQDSVRICDRGRDYNGCGGGNNGVIKERLNERRKMVRSSTSDNTKYSKESVIYSNETKRTHQSQLNHVPNNFSDQKCNDITVCSKHRPRNFMFSGCMFLLALASSCFASETVQDHRCFNVAGGPVENFFVKESLPVGSVIGSLGVEGDPGPMGDIFLRLESQDVPVQITAGTKDLILTSTLDKEGEDGINYVSINVSCKRRGTTEPSINIPVNIRVTDVNDNAPIFLNSPYYVTLSEVLMIGTVINADIEAVDEDQAGPFSTVQYFIMPGPNSHHFAIQSPLRGELVLKRPLDYETEPLFNITIMAQDQGLPPQNTTTVLTVQVLDADDQNPVFRSERYTAVLPDKPTKGSALEVRPESLLAEDKDEEIKAPIIYSLARAEDDSQWFNINPTTGVITLAGDLPDQVLIQPTILLIKAVQEDNPDRQGVTTLTVSRSEHFSTQIQFLQREYITAVPESLSLDSVIMTTRINKNIDEKTMFSLENNGMGVFHITTSGKIILKSPLDYEDSQEYNVRIYVTDGKSNDTALLKVDILNVNDWDPLFENQSYEFYVESADLRPGDFVGKIRVTDDDTEDHVSLSVVGEDARMFSINDIGELMIQDISDINNTEVNLIVMARDSLTPTRTSSVPVTIQFPDNMVQSLPLGQGSSWMLMLVFGSVLIVFIIVIICLVIYIHRNKKKERDEKAMASNMIHHNGTLLLDPIPPLHQALKGLIPMTTATVKTRSPIRVQSPVPPDLNNQETNNNLAKGSIRSHNGSERSEQSFLAGKVQHRNGLVPAATVFPNSHRPTYGDSISLNGSLNGSAKSYATTITVNSCRLPSTLHSTRTPLPFFIENDPENDKTTSFRTPSMGEARAIGGLPMSKVSPVTNTTNSDRHTGSTNSTNSNASTPTRELHADTPLDYDEVWPKGSSVPRRVKKLSWEDERNSQVELDPEESVEPISSSSSSNELTVYF